jgi:hypothetical protein
MAKLSISQRDIDALARTATSEVGHFSRYGEATLKGAVEAVVDTIINRSVHPNYPHSIEGVVNQRAQFSAIGGPGGTGTWTGLPSASPAVYNIVQGHLEERANGGACSVQGATHFLNPYLSSPSALREWGNHVWNNPVAVWGRGRDIHYHGFAPGAHPPPPYTITFRGKSCDFSGRGVAQAPIAAPDMIAREVAVPAEAQFARMALAPEQDSVAAEARTYRVEVLAPGDLAELQDTLNSFSDHGWRLRQLISDKTDFLAVLERSAPSRPTLETSREVPISDWTEQAEIAQQRHVLPTRTIKPTVLAPSEVSELLPNPRNADMNVNPKLLSVIKDGVRRFQIANPQYTVEVYGPSSGKRKKGRTSNHGPQQNGYGGALDIIIIRRSDGAWLSNYQDGDTAPIYQQLANYVKLAQEELLPALKIRFGGYFSGERQKYGALDLMHFDVLARKGMAGGSWEDGFTRKMMQYWGIKKNMGMREFRKSAIS